jgi:polysaccharide export outer membrane protein
MIPSLRTLTLALTTLAGLALVSLQTGCQSGPPREYMDVDAGTWAAPQPAQPPQGTQAETPPVAPTNSAAQAIGRTDLFRVDDVVVVTVGGVVSEVIPDHEERIKEDGSISLYLVGKVQAAGKTAGELQSELQRAYEKFYKNPVVTVKSFQRYYSVGGEVKRPGAQVYLAETSVTKAIQAAGDFTDFANKRSIRVTRADGTTLKVNFKKILNNPRLDPPIYPGDTIHVPRRWWLW